MCENDVNQTIKIDIFLEKFIKLWTMRYNPLRDFGMLKADLKKTLIFCFQCGILRAKDTDFDVDYLKKIYTPFRTASRKYLIGCYQNFKIIFVF
jgi:hypothetical protein